MLKKLLIMLLITPIFFIVGCGGSSDTDNGGNSNPPSVEEPTIKEFKNVKMEDKSVIFDGNKHSLEVSGDLPTNTKITYINNDQVNAGVYKVTAILECNGYNTKTVDGTLTIKKADLTVQFLNTTVVYDGTEQEITIVGELPEGVTVTYENNKLTNVGTIEATAHFKSTNPNYNDIPSVKATLTVLKAKVNINQSNFSDKEYVYDGKEKELVLDCEIPSCVEVKYTNNKLTEISSITAKVELRLLDTTNYEPLEFTTLTAKLSVILDKNITYITDSYGNINITGYTGNAEILMIPELVDGKTVTKIDTQAFMNSSIKEIKLPNTITTIADEAFVGCYNLTTIDLPTSLMNLGTYVFSGSGLQTIILPKNLTSIPAGTFMLSKLSTINMADNITTIGDSCFMNCSNLVSIKLSDNLKTIGDSCFMNCSNLEEFNIPNTCTTIKDNAFNGIGLAKIIIPKSVVNMGANVFRGRIKYFLVENTKDYLRKFNWPYDWGGYDENNELTSVYYDYINSVKTYNDMLYYYSYLYSENYIIDYLGKSANITIPSSINGNSVHLAKYAFTNTNIKSLVIEDGVSIYYRSFYGCEELTSVRLPSDLKNIPERLFENCSKLTSIVIPNSVTDISDYAFRGCTSLNDITLSTSLRSLGDYVFDNCTSLTSLTFPGSMKELNGDYGLSTCTNLKEVILERGITAISNAGPSSFANCKNLTTIKLPNTLTTIGYNTFANCSSLVSINLPYSLTTIGTGAFEDCSSLTSVTLPNSITSIGDDAFHGCSSLTSVTLSNSITSIGYAAFRGCSSLTSVTLPNSITSIGASAFSGCSSLTSVTLPNSITSIGDFVFNGCSSLTSVTLPNSITSIGESAFEGCSSLTSVTLPNSITSIGANAFWDCSSLKYIYCEAKSKPTDWHDNWNGYTNAEVIWGYKRNA